MPEKRFDDYVARLVTEPIARTAYLNDPSAAMEAAKLSEVEQKVLATRRFDTILSYLQECKPRPTPPVKETFGDDGEEEGGTGEPIVGQEIPLDQAPVEHA